MEIDMTFERLVALETYLRVKNSGNEIDLLRHLAKKAGMLTSKNLKSWYETSTMCHYEYEYIKHKNLHRHIPNFIHDTFFCDYLVKKISFEMNISAFEWKPSRPMIHVNAIWTCPFKLSYEFRSKRHEINPEIFRRSHLLGNDIVYAELFVDINLEELSRIVSETFMLFQSEAARLVHK